MNLVCGTIRVAYHIYCLMRAHARERKGRMERARTYIVSNANLTSVCVFLEFNKQNCHEA